VRANLLTYIISQIVFAVSIVALGVANLIGGLSVLGHNVSFCSMDD